MAADTIAVGQSAATQEQLRAEFSLLEAAKLSDRDVTDKQIEAYTELRGHMTAQQALQAAGIKWDADEVAAFDRTTASIKLRTNELEKAKIAESISFGRQTAFLTPEDVQIAQQLKTIYGTDIPAALASSQAAAMRLNKTFSDLGTLGRDSLSGFAVDFKNQLTTGAGAWKSFETAGANALNKISDKLMQMAIDGLWSKAFGGAGATGLGGILAMFGMGGASANLASSNAAATGASAGDLAYAMRSGGMVGVDGQRTYVHPAYFENAPHFGMGGMITDGGVPIIAHPGERVLNRQQTAAYNSGSGSSVINMGHIYIDASGADPAIVARLQATLESFRKSQYADTVKIVQDASNRGMRLHS